MGANSGNIRIELLGAPRAWSDGIEIALGTPKQRAVLGILASHVNEVVNTEQIVDAVWGEHMPRTCVNGVHTYIARLRRALTCGRSRADSDAVLVSTVSGYSLRLDSACVDAAVFARRHTTARRLRAEGDSAGAAEELRAALDLWHGEAYAGVPGPFAGVERTRLHELRLTAVEEWAGDMFALDRHAETLEVLSSAVVDEPLRERLPWLLMLGLYRCGRRAQALRVYWRTRQLLADELDIEPSEDLRQLYERILTSDAERERDGPVAAAASAVVELGRSARRGEREGSERLARAEGRRTPQAAVADRLPGSAQCTGDRLLRDPCVSGGLATADGYALGQSLVRLGFRHEELPADLTSRAALYRSLLEGRRILVVLDDEVHAG